MVNFSRSVLKIYTGQKKFTRAAPVAPVTNIRYDFDKVSYFLPFIVILIYLPTLKHLNIQKIFFMNRRLLPKYCFSIAKVVVTSFAKLVHIYYPKWLGECSSLRTQRYKNNLVRRWTGLHKLWYPGIRDRSTWSKFGAHGEHGDVFLFSNLGALWFSENLIRYSLHICLREVKNNLFSFKNSYLRHFSWRF